MRFGSGRLGQDRMTGTWSRARSSGSYWVIGKVSSSEDSDRDRPIRLLIRNCVITDASMRNQGIVMPGLEHGTPGFGCTTVQPNVSIISIATISYGGNFVRVFC